MIDCELCVVILWYDFIVKLFYDRCCSGKGIFVKCKVGCFGMGGFFGDIDF